MIIGEIIKTVLQNAFAALFLVAIMTSIAKVRRARARRQPVETSYILWGEMLFYVYGIANIYGGFFHAYDGTAVAATIGWGPSPFQYELGWLEIGYGITALLSLRRCYDFRFALTLPYSIFALAAAAQHIQMMNASHNYAPNNAGLVLWLGDILIPLMMFVLAWFSRGARTP